MCKCLLRLKSSVKQSHCNKDTNNRQYTSIRVGGHELVTRGELVDVRCTAGSSTCPVLSCLATIMTADILTDFCVC